MSVQTIMYDTVSKLNNIPVTFIYEGETLNINTTVVPHGTGVLYMMRIDPSCIVYQGKWKNGKTVNDAKLITPSFQYYIGPLHTFQKSGIGSVVYPNYPQNTTIKGHFINDELDPPDNTIDGFCLSPSQDEA